MSRAGERFDPPFGLRLLPARYRERQMHKTVFFTKLQAIGAVPGITDEISENLSTCVLHLIAISNMRSLTLMRVWRNW